MGGKLSYPHQDIPEDRTFLITGGNTGIGYQTAKSVAKLGGRVVIACRNEEKAKEAIEKMQKEHQEEVKKKRADEKAAAAKEKEKADKAAAAKAAAERKKSNASKPEEKKEDAAKDDAEAKTDPPKEGETNDAAKEETPKEDAPKEDAPKEDAPKEDAPKEDAPKETPAENAVNDETPKEEEKTTSEGAATAEAKPDEEVTEEKKEEVEEVEEPISPLNVEFMVLDLESFESTMKFVEAFKAKGYPLHVLICNAGFGAGQKETTSDGYEKHFQVNYLSHFLMTLHLLPLLRQSAPNSRIINVSSTLHTSGVFNLDNVNGEQSYDRVKFYGNSKLYQVMSMYAFERRLQDTGISVFSVHPGYVDSDFHKGAADSKLYSFMDSIAGTFRMKRNVQDGAMTSLVAALDANLDGKTGIYFKSCKPANSSPASKKVENQEALWKFSVDLLKEKNVINDDLLKDLTLPEPEPTGESKPEGEAKPEEEAKAEGDAAAGGDATKTEEEKKPEETKEEKKEEEKKEEDEKKEEGAGDAPTEEKKDETAEEKKE